MQRSRCVVPLTCTKLIELDRSIRSGPPRRGWLASEEYGLVHAAEKAAAMVYIQLNSVFSAHRTLDVG